LLVLAEHKDIDLMFGLVFGDGLGLDGTKATGLLSIVPTEQMPNLTHF
jgi:hypothetical protein